MTWICISMPLHRIYCPIHIAWMYPCDCTCKHYIVRMDLRVHAWPIVYVYIYCLAHIALTSYMWLCIYSVAWMYIVDQNTLQGWLYSSIDDSIFIPCDSHIHHVILRVYVVFDGLNKIFLPHCTDVLSIWFAMYI